MVRCLEVGADYSGDQKRRENSRFVLICTGKGQHKARHLVELWAEWPRDIVASAFYVYGQEDERRRLLRGRTEPGDAVPEYEMYFARVLTESYVHPEELLLRAIFNAGQDDAKEYGYGVEFGAWPDMWKVVVSTRRLADAEARLAEAEDVLRLQYEVGDITKAEYLEKTSHSPDRRGVLELSSNAAKSIRGRRHLEGHNNSARGLFAPSHSAYTFTCPTCKRTCRTTGRRLRVLASKVWPKGLDRVDLSLPSIMEQLTKPRRS